MLHSGPPRLTPSAALRDLGSRDARARVAAADALGEPAIADAVGRADAADALVAALRDLAPEVRQAAALALGELGFARAIEPLVRLMDDGVPAVRQSAVMALGRLGMADGFAPLATALKDGPPDVRFQAASSLVEIDADDALAPLLAALDDGDGEVVGAAALGLATIADPRAIEPLAARLDHPRRETRFDVAYALARLASSPHGAGRGASTAPGRLSDGRGLAVLSEALRDPRHGWDAAEALELGDPAAVTAPLLAAATDDQLPREVVLRAAAALITVAPDGAAAERARGVLIRGLSALRHRHRALAVDLLGRVGGAWARAPLDRLAAAPLFGRRLTDEIAAARRAIDARAVDPERPR